MRKYKEGLTPERIAELKFKLALAEEKENIAGEMIEGLHDQIRDFADEQDEIEAELYEPEPVTTLEWWQGEWDYLGTKLSNLRQVVTVQTPAQRILAGERFREGIVQSVTDKKDGTTELCIAASYASADFPSVYKTHRAADGTPVFFSKELEFNKEPYLGSDKCHCDMSTIMATGCKCGGK